MEREKSGRVEPKPIAPESTLVLAPEDPAHRVAIQSSSGELMLFDGRNKAQNGWYVVRTLLPAGRFSKAVE